ncbi:HNH endonuclease [Bacillus anthracis]|nr:HNH endonuclease [Bacillus anthracis]
MVVTFETKRMLWALSGNRCAICKTALLKKGKKENIGEIAHIVAKSKDMTRGDEPLPMEKRDDYSNLILLCANHHTIIDNDRKVEDYPVERLHRIKEEHEKFIESRLQGDFLEEIEIDHKLLESHFKSMKKVSEYEFSREQLEKCIEEYFSLDEKEQKVLHRLLKIHVEEGELDVPKVARKIQGDLSILESLKEFRFLHYYDDENLFRWDEDDMSYIDYNQIIEVSAFEKYNWVLGEYGEIICRVYSLLGKQKKFKEFNREFRMGFLDLSN